MVPAERVETMAGFQVPVIPFKEVVGKAGPALFRHKGPMAANAGVIEFVISTFRDIDPEHWPTAGIKI